MEESESTDSEKVLFKTKGKLSLEEVYCFVTEGYVVIEAQKPIRIPISHIKDCNTYAGDISGTSSVQAPQPFSGTATLTFLDDLGQKHKLPLEMAIGELAPFKQAIDRQMVGRFFDIVEERPPDTGLRNLFLNIKEFCRDKTRDEICAHLQALGIDARMVERGGPEENIERTFGLREKSLGLIHIPEGPIRWVNVWKRGGGEHEKDHYYTDCGVPDARLPSDSPRIRINVIRKKTVPLVGKVVDLCWGGNDLGLGIINRLNSDDQLRHTIMGSHDVAIKGIGDYGCWIISAEQKYEGLSPWLWSCYQAIARHLLAEWSSSSNM
jgi:hypothetical protein